MNLYSLILLLGVSFSVAMSIIVYLRNKNNTINQAFAFLTILTAFCSFVNYLISMSETEEEVQVLLNLVSIRTLIFPVTVQFLLLYAEKGKLLKKIWIYPLLYAFPAFLIITVGKFDLFSLKYLGSELGWNFYPEHNLLSDIIGIWIVLMFIIIHYLGIMNVIRAKDYIKKRQAWFILVGLFISLGFPVITDILLPLHHIEIPQSASGSFMIGFILIGYAIIRYELFSPTPESAADNIINNVNDTVIITQPHGTITFANIAAQQVTGYTVHELLGKSINIFFDDTIIDEIRYPESGNMNIELLARGGKKVPVMVSHTILYIYKGQVGGHVFIIHEMTEVKKLMDQLAERELRYKNIFHNIQDVYFELLPDSTITEVSPSIEHLTSYTREEVMGKSFSMLFPDGNTSVNLLEMLVSDHNVGNFEAMLFDKDGSTQYCIINSMYVLKDGKPQKIVGSITNIDELKKAEIQVIESEKRYRLVTENSADFVAQMGEDGIFVYISPSFRSFGYEPDEFIGTQGNDFVHPDDLPKLQYTIYSNKSPGSRCFIEFRMRHADGHYIWVEGRCKWVTGENRLYLICNAHNISFRKQVETKLKESEEKFRLLFEKSPDGILLAKDIHTHVACNDALLNIFGYDSFRELLSEPPFSLALPEYKAQIIERNKLRNSGKASDGIYQMKIRRKDGQIRHVEYRVYEIIVQNEKLLQVIMSDITEKIEAERKLIESEQRYSLLVENSPDDIFLVGENGKFLMVNTHAADSLDMQRDDLPGKFLSDVFPAHIAERQLSSIQKVFQTGQMSENIKTITITALGERWYDTVLVPVKNSENNVVSVIGIGRDITEIEKAELKIRKNEEKYRLFLENFRGIALRVGADNRLEFLYGEVQEITGYSIEEFLRGIPKIWKMVHPEDRVKLFQAFRMLKKLPNSKITKECRIIHRNGGIRYLRIFMQNLMDEQGNLSFLQLALFDKTDIYELQNQIINAITETEDRERLRFAEDLHDEVGPLLSSIRVYVHLIQSKGAGKEAERAELVEFTKQLIDDAVMQTKNISYNIMPEILSIYGLIPSVKSFCNKIDKTCDLHFQITTESFRDDERFDSKLELALYRAIKELINNTIKHAGGTTITIRFFKTHEFHAIEFIDDGVGFVFSDKVNEGSGLGLRNIIHRIQSVNGSVHFDSAPGSGTRVLIRW